MNGAKQPRHGQAFAEKIFLWPELGRPFQRRGKRRRDPFLNEKSLEKIGSKGAPGWRKPGRIEKSHGLKMEKPAPVQEKLFPAEIRANPGEIKPGPGVLMAAQGPGKPASEKNFKNLWQN